jgi:hypothetical protein
MHILLVKQDWKTEDTCGQCCVAMLLQISKTKAVQAIGHKNATKSSELRRALQLHEMRIGSRLRKFIDFDNVSDTAILLGEWRRGKNKCQHWVVWSAPYLYDPIEGVLKVDARVRPSHFRPTHYLPVRGSDGRGSGKSRV